MKTEISESALDSRVRRAARRAGYEARKSRQGYHANNLGGYQLIDPYRNMVVYGRDYDPSAEDVLSICAE